MISKNTKQERLPQAPRAPLPELAEFLAPLRVHFTQGPSAETLRQYLTGLLSEHPNKNCDTLAEVVPETTEQQFHHLLTDMVWDETALNHQRIARMRTLPSEGDGRQTDQLSGHGQLSLRRAHAGLARSHAAVSAPGVGGRGGAPGEGARAGGPHLSDQSRAGAGVVG